MSLQEQVWAVEVLTRSMPSDSAIGCEGSYSAQATCPRLGFGLLRANAEVNRDEGKGTIRVFVTYSVEREFAGVAAAEAWLKAMVKGDRQGAPEVLGYRRSAPYPPAG